MVSGLGLALENDDRRNFGQLVSRGCACDPCSDYNECLGLHTDNCNTFPIRGKESWTSGRTLGGAKRLRLTCRRLRKSNKNLVGAVCEGSVTTRARFTGLGRTAALWN